MTPFSGPDCCQINTVKRLPLLIKLMYKENSAVKTPRIFKGFVIQSTLTNVPHQEAWENTTSCEPRPAH